MSASDAGAPGAEAAPPQDAATQGAASKRPELLKVTPADEIDDGVIAVRAVPDGLTAGQVVVVSALSLDGTTLQPELHLSLEVRAVVPTGYARVSLATLGSLHAVFESRLIIRSPTKMEQARRYNTPSVWLAAFTFLAAAVVLGFAISSMVASQPSGRRELADQLRPLQTAIAAAGLRGDLPSIQHDSQVLAADLNATKASDDSGPSNTDLAGAVGGFVCAILSGWIAISGIRGRRTQA